MEKSKVLIQFLVIFRQFGDVLSFLYARRLRGYTATPSKLVIFNQRCRLLCGFENSSEVIVKQNASLPVAYKGLVCNNSTGKTN